MRRVMVIGCGLVWLCTAGVAGPLRNGGFEDGAEGVAPYGWEFRCSGECKGGLAFDPEVKVEGSRSVRLSSESGHKAHRYCGLSQNVGPLYPDRTYRLSFRAKAEGAGSCWYGGGPGWKLRRQLPQGSFDWQEFSIEFDAKRAETYHFRINVDSVTKALWVDDVRLSPDYDESKPLIEAMSVAESAVVPILPEAGVRIDGRLDDWTARPFPLADEAGRIHAAFRLGWSKKALVVAVEVEDDAATTADVPESMWPHDSIQLAIDPFNEKHVGKYGPHDVEIDCGMLPDGPTVYARGDSAKITEAVTRRTQLAIHRGGRVTVYEVAVPWKAFGGFAPQAGTAFGFNIVVNDRDEGGGGRAMVEWTPGVVFAKSPAEYKTLVLTEGPWVHLMATPKELVSTGLATVSATLFLPRAGKGVLRVAPLFEKEVAVEPGLTQCTYYASADRFQKGENALELIFTLDGREYKAQTTVVRSTADEDALELIALQEARLPNVREKLEAARDDGLPVFYPEADVSIAEIFCRYCRDDVAHGRHNRALEVAEEVRDLLDRAEAEMRLGVDVPVADIGTVTVRDGSFRAKCRVGGRDEERPVFLTGYGHFGPVVQALPLFPKIGINVIQIEMGPRSVVLEDGIATDQVQGYVIHALDRARDNGVAICLLTSPHYFPGWAFEKWPEIRADNGFLRNTLDAPQVRDIYEKYLRTLIPMIKDHPALHSICLSNEPVSLGSPDDPFRLPLWHEYIKQKHGTIAALNACYGTDYAAFDDVQHPRFAFGKNDAALYDAVRFNQERFAEWHAWMVGIIHEMAPDLPCHAKVMALPGSRHTVFWGTDPWDFAKLSQINGNDCYFLPHFEEPWESRWNMQNMYYDLQRSMKRVPVFNTENHIIRDRERRHVSGEHIYAAIWQGAIHGQGGSTTWAWQRTYDETSDFEGLILHRPVCTAAMSRCALDLMRLSREVAALQNATPRVAILYSHAATIHGKRYVGARSTVYEALNFCGVPLGFITDEQVAAGWLAKYDCLIVPGAEAASRAAIEGIRTYLASGGHVVAVGAENLVIDEYGRSVEPVRFTATLKRSRREALRDALAHELAEAGVEPDIALKSPFGVEWRNVEYDGRPLVNLINLTSKPINVRLPKGQWTDLITRAGLAPTVTLGTNVPVLALGK